LQLTVPGDKNAAARPGESQAARLPSGERAARNPRCRDGVGPMAKTAILLGPPRHNDSVPQVLCLLGLPEDLGNLLDLGEQLVGRRNVERRLRAAPAAGQLGGLVEELVQL